VWIIADQGQTAFNSGQSSLEACVVDPASGDLAKCDTAGTTNLPWVDQGAAATGPKGFFGLGAQLWDVGGIPTVASWMGATDESLGSGPTISSAACDFWHVDLTTDASCNFAPTAKTGCSGYGCAVSGNQSADGKFLARAYYRTVRVAGYVFAVGGWRSDLNGVASDMERNLQ
jgi:hypothetical protein